MLPHNIIPEEACLAGLAIGPSTESELNGERKTMQDFADTEPTGYYEAAIGEKNQEYYVDKFEAFDQKGGGLNASWNWAAFLFAGTWALYRKMYGWFFAWLVVYFVAGVLERLFAQASPNVRFVAGIVYLVGWLSFGAFANSLYHAKIKKRIDAINESTADIAKIEKRLKLKSGVNAWVPIVVIAIFVLGILLAVALPAYQGGDKIVKTPGISDAPLKPFHGKTDEALKQAESQPPSAKGEIDNFLDKAELRKWGIGGNQELSDVAAWGDSQLIGRSFQGDSLIKARSFVLMWQRLIIQKTSTSPEVALHEAYNIVLGGLDNGSGLCRPDFTRDGGLKVLPDEKYQLSPECIR